MDQSAQSNDIISISFANTEFAASTTSSHFHQLLSTNSFEFTAATTSLSEDSGLPNTNSSISSGDSSSRVGPNDFFCGVKLEFESTESDGEVSQLDSLENCSDGGMSAENFNTLKKGPLPPIDPPPEFQDSPQTTLLRSAALQSYAFRIAKSLISSAVQHFIIKSRIDKDVVVPVQRDAMKRIELIDTTIPIVTQHSLNCRYAASNNICASLLTDHVYSNVSDNNQSFGGGDPETNATVIPIVYNTKLKERSYKIYASDSFLNQKSATVNIDNIYDIPNSDLSDCCSSCNSRQSSCNSLSSSYSLTNMNGLVDEIDAIKLQDRLRQRKQQQLQQKLFHTSQIYDYDLYYKRSSNKSSSPATCNSLQKLVKSSILYSPLHLSLSGQPQNSRNSLNSRLSSSHNSLAISTLNKADDSMFITQAMSHDALTGHEITDFYTVPIDSEFYASPVDVIRSTDNKIDKYIKNNRSTIDSNQNKSNKIKYPKKSKKRKSRELIESNKVHVPVGTDRKIYKERPVNRKVKNSKLNEEKRHSVPENETNPRQFMDSSIFYQHVYSSSTDSGADMAICSNSKLSTFAVLHNDKSQINFMNNNNLIHNNNNNNKDLANGNGKYRTNVTGDGNFKQNNISSNGINVVSHWQLTKSKLNKLNKKNATKQSEQTKKGLTNQKTYSDDKQSYSENSFGDNCSISKQNNDQTEPICNNQNMNNKKFAINLKQKFCSIFRFRKSHSHPTTNYINTSISNSVLASNSNSPSSIPLINRINSKGANSSTVNLTTGNTLRTSETTSLIGVNCNGTGTAQQTNQNCLRFSTRALPPLPGDRRNGNYIDDTNNTTMFDGISAVSNFGTRKSDDADSITHEVTSQQSTFASNVEKVKDCGWYWGPISSEAAEKILSNEPDGSFIVRDSSDDHYIFSLTFKLQNCVRHVRIEQDQGTFSFGSCARFKSRTIMEFIENAVESSRSGRYLFFFHRRPEHGPMRVQLTNPVSRFKHIQSLQHMCRFVIRKTIVRKDLIEKLELPRRLIDYLSYKHCYSEQVESDSSPSQICGDDNVT